MNFDTLYAATARATASYIALRVRSPEDAQDLLQETYLKVWRAWSQTPEHSTLWIRRIAHNTIIDYYRSRARRHEEDITLVGLTTDPIGAWQSRETLREVLRSLDVRYRDVFLLNEVAGYTFAEIAEARHINLHHAYYFYQRARLQAQRYREWSKI